MALRLALLFTFIVAGCPKKGPDRDREVDRLLVAADDAWTARGSTGLETASAPLLEAWQHNPRHIGVSWRLARLRVAEGIVAEDPNAARVSYADARSLAMGCLEQYDTFASRRTTAGMQLAIGELPAGRFDRCVAWGALAWSRWMAVTGGGGTTLDLEAAEALAAGASNSTDEQARGVARWATAVLLAVRPTWIGGDPAAARAEFDDAIEAEPDVLVLLVDLYTMVLQPTNDPDAATVRAQILAASPTTPEDTAAQAKVAASD